MSPVSFKCTSATCPTTCRAPRSTAFFCRNCPSSTESKWKPYHTSNGKLCCGRGAVQARMHVVDERRHRHVVQHGREGVEVTFEAGPRGPALEADAGLVGGMAGRHPFRFLDAEALEEPAQPRRGAFAHADHADLR